MNALLVGERHFFAIVIHEYAEYFNSVDAQEGEPILANG